MRIRGELVGVFFGFGLILVLLIIGYFLPRAPAPRRFQCHMVSDGSVYCREPNGKIFRPRFDDFVLEVNW